MDHTFDSEKLQRKIRQLLADHALDREHLGAITVWDLLQDGEIQAQDIQHFREKQMREQQKRNEFDLLSAVFEQSLAGMFLNILDEPVDWKDSLNKDAVLDEVFHQHRATKVNRAMLDMFGEIEEEFLAATPHQLFQENPEHWRTMWRELYDTGHMRIQTEETRADGIAFSVLGDYICIYDEQERIRGHFGIILDVTEKRIAESKAKKYRKVLQEQNQLIEMILDNAPIGIWMSGDEPASIFTNSFFKEHFDLTPKEVEVCRGTDRDAYSRNGPQHYEEIVTFKDQKKHILETVKTKVIGENGSVSGLLGIGLDITERKEAEAALKASEEKHRLLTENISDVIWVFNLNQQRFTYISPSIEQLRGYTVAEALAQRMEEALTPESLRLVHQQITSNLPEFIANSKLEKSYITEVQQPCKNGEIIWVETSTKYRYNAAQEIEIVGVSRNIELKKRAEQEVLYLSYHDQLTGLKNRRFYEEELKRLDAENHLPLTLILADVNGLKLTNDAFGHEAGDKLLQTFAKVLRQVGREQDCIARIGGDEFALLLPQTDGDTAQAVIAEIRGKITGLQQERMIVSAALGSGTKTYMEQTLGALFKEAEEAMYHHKLLESAGIKNEIIKLATGILFERNAHAQRHSERVSELCQAIGTAMGLGAEQIRELELTGYLHDIGKVGSDEFLLDGQRELGDAETRDIKRHPEIGYHILKSVNEFYEIAHYVLAHHERLDGKGYPRGLKGQEIPLQARILSIADAFDWLTRGQGPKPAVRDKEAARALKAQAGTLYDEGILKIFVEMVLGESWDGV